ncbi:hypothetical protein [Cupriavidus pinatubonensis]|uniref:hypothetical protein n=1 Tax=Cupriavidus pinatubonensis TaxID=248026 RepID=UPI00112D7727|nr:hypothetical protein [Cupriavidus pinatubonensis]TPQ32035.1 hypothetical protein C2U69_27495 [Cupriavidus pinatubonensis]
MNWSLISERTLDQYELRARLLPGLLVLLPAVAFFALLYGTKSPMVVGLGSVMATCGGPYLLSSFVRTHGLRAQERLYQRWGGPPTTLLLRHRDTHLPLQTKLHYHELAASRLGVVMPRPEEEQQDPARADEAYAAAADALRPLTTDRKAFPFVFKELVTYGFNRNAYGSRWVGFFVSMATTVATLLHAEAFRPLPPYWAPEELDAIHVVVLVLALGFAALWCMHFTGETVRYAGVGYAKRLWESLKELPKKPSRARLSRAKSGEGGGTPITPKET